LSNAHASTTPHHVGQVAKAEIQMTAKLEEWGSPQADKRGPELVQAFLELGWTAPRDLTEAPPLRPDRQADPNHRAACMDEIRSVFNRPRDT
jgi:hypothetical protein